MVSVVVPAHDEAAVIGRCLGALSRTARPDDLEVIVVANGCTDATVEVASRFPGVRTMVIPQASKHAAIVVGDAAASHPYRAIVDADVEVSGDALIAVAEAMEGTEFCIGAPRLALEMIGCPWFVRSYHRVWTQTGWSTVAPVGSGVYVLSERGRAMLGEFPAVTNDDQYVHDLFTVEQRLCLRDELFVVHPPRTLSGLVRRRTRTVAAQRELDATYGFLPGRVFGPGPVDIARAEPRRWGDVALFIGVKLMAAQAARRKRRVGSTLWERDDSSRIAPAA